MSRVLDAGAFMAIERAGPAGLVLAGELDATLAPDRRSLRRRLGDMALRRAGFARRVTEPHSSSATRSLAG